MKNLIKLQRIVFALLLAGLVPACKSGDEPQVTIEDIQNEVRAKLSGNWSITSAVKDGLDVSADYTDFTIGFSNSTLTTSNGGLIWPTSISWDFKSGSTTTIVRSDLVEMAIAFSNNDSVLQLTFAVVDSSVDGGRLTNILGDYVFTVEK